MVWEWWVVEEEVEVMGCIFVRGVREVQKRGVEGVVQIVTTLAVMAATGAATVEGVVLELMVIRPPTGAPVVEK